MIKEKFKTILSSKEKPLLLDGALGTYLQEKGFVPDKYLWYSYLNITQPKIIEEIHREYILSGADIITTNTFRTNPLAKKYSNYQITNSELVKKSVQLAINAKEEKEIIIAGSNAPAEDCYQQKRNVTFFDLEYNHKKHIELLYESGVDIIWNETHSHKDEIELICKFCSDNKIPFAMNIYFKSDFKILSGESLNEILETVLCYYPDVIGFNCIKPNDLIDNISKINFPNNWGFYFNCGQSDVQDEQIICTISPTNYKEIVKNLIPLKPKFIGACCGSNPNHIKEIRELIDEIY